MSQKIHQSFSISLLFAIFQHNLSSPYHYIANYIFLSLQRVVICIYYLQYSPLFVIYFIIYHLLYNLLQ